MSNPTLKTGHVGLNVSDLARSLEFYRSLFDFDVVAQQLDGERAFVMLGQNGRISLTLWQQSSGTFATDRPGLHHLSFEVPDIETVRQAEATLKRLGVTFVYDGVVPHAEGAASGGIYFTDPDGVRLEIYAPTGADIAPAPVSAAPTCGFF